MKYFRISIERLGEMYGVKKPFVADIIDDKLIFVELDPLNVPEACGDAVYWGDES